MPNREKVVKGFECCITDPNGLEDCKMIGCPYIKEAEETEEGESLYCQTCLFADALSLLKEQGAKHGKWRYCKDVSGQDGYQCSECGFFEPWYYEFENHNFITDYQFCPSCGSLMQEGG